MPAQDQLVECHRMYSKGDGEGGWFCWRMVGRGVVQVPLITAKGHVNDLFTNTHPLEYQVSIRPTEAGECKDHPDGIEPDRYGNFIMDTMFWRETT